MSGGRAGGFRKRAGQRQKGDESSSNPGDYFGLGDLNIGGEYKDYLAQGPDLPDWLGGGSLVISPNEAIDPFDCDRWPGSPYCGEIPFGENFIGVDVGLSISECETVLSLEGTLGWWRMPPLEIGVRRCEKPLAPPPIPSPPESQDQRLPLFCRGRGPHRIFGRLWGVHRECALRDPFTNRCITDDYTEEAFAIPGGNSGPLPWDPTGQYGAYSSDVFWGPIHGVVIRATPSAYETNIYQVLVICHGWYYGPTGVGPTADPVTRELIGSGTYNSTPAGFGYDVIAPNCRPAQPLALPRPAPNTGGGPDDMACNCKALEASLKRIERVLGIPQLYSGGHSGWRMPAKLAGTDTETTTTLDNYATLLNWLVAEIRDSLGDTSFSITVKDANLLQEGNQEQTITIPNLAEGMAETIGLLLKTNAVLQATYAAASSSLAQAGNASVSAARAALEAQEIADFLGYSGRDVAFDVPLCFTPEKDAPHEFLKPSVGKGTYRECTEKNDLQIQMRILQQAADIIRAVYGVRMDTTSIDQELEGIRAASTGGGDIDVLLNDIETGFLSDLATEDSTPYGRPYLDRPKLTVVRRPAGPDGGDNGANP